MKTQIAFYASALCLILNVASAQDVVLHQSSRWTECSFQLDPSLTQQEWHEFTQEAGMVACFRPLTSARPMGKGRIEVSLLQWKTRIDETKGAWNNTFVHPNAEHYLVGGDELPFPGLSLRAGLSSKLDLGVYWSYRPGANYGFMGAQVQYNLLSAEKNKIDLSPRLGFNMIYGPEDLNFMISNLDLLASKEFKLYRNWLSLSPYAGTSVYLSHAHEKSDLVNLHDENVAGIQGMLGAVIGIYHFNIAAEYNLSKVNSLSFRLGYNFKF
ncbi:MAG TPA: hypothetical protein PLQ93_01710 [Bacteroidia bacterium]|nr:hypothetical protein [Bacteroidia bacterium]